MVLIGILQLSSLSSKYLPLSATATVHRHKKRSCDFFLEQLSQINYFNGGIFFLAGLPWPSNKI